MAAPDPARMGAALGGAHPSGKAEFAIGIESNCREKRTEKGGLR